MTARICLEVGIDTHDILTGTRAEAMSDAELVPKWRNAQSICPWLDAAVTKHVFYKRYREMVIPLVFFDGINDAPALRDVRMGISVDSAADIAKESSDIILLERSHGA